MEESRNLIVFLAVVPCRALQAWSLSPIHSSQDHRQVRSTGVWTDGGAEERALHGEAVMKKEIKCCRLAIETSRGDTVRCKEEGENLGLRKSRGEGRRRPGGMSEQPELKEQDEEALWELIDDNRHCVSLGVQPCLLIPYLRQARVLDELDEDEILHCLQFTNRCMKTSRMLDILRTRGRNGAIAFLESLMIHYPKLYTKISGRKPSTAQSGFSGRMLDILRTRGRNGAIAFLESLMIHYPKLYTKISGRKPSTAQSGFSGLMENSELTEYLVRAVTGMQEQLCSVRAEAGSLAERCAALEAELGQARQQGEGLHGLQAEHARLRRDYATLHRDLLRLKDEKCDLCTRFTAAVEENSVVAARCRDLQLEVYQLKFELQKAMKETDFERKKSLRSCSSGEILHLREEVAMLRQRLAKAEKFSPAREDILETDLEEALDGRCELMEQIHCLREEHDRLVSEHEELLEQKESLALQAQKLTLDCEMYQQKSAVMQAQLRDLQTERDQAYLARDEAQAQIAKSLSEKDALRLQVVELQDQLFTLQTQQKADRRVLMLPVCVVMLLQRRTSSSSSPWQDTLALDTPPARAKLCRMNAIGSEAVQCHSLEDCDEALCSFGSQKAEPPSSESLRRREEELQHNRESSQLGSWDCLPSALDMENDYVFVSEEPEPTAAEPPLPSPDSRPSDGIFMKRMRPQALRHHSHVTTISFQGEALLSQLQVVGGNETGVFVHCVTEGSAAHSVGIRPGAQIMAVECEQQQQVFQAVLEDSTMEEALWALRQVRGFCCLSLRPNQEGYHKLLSQLQSGQVTSGDSFYVRVNVSLSGGCAGGLAVQCNDIVHVTNTRYRSDGTWHVSRTHPCQLRDLESGALPNYYRAQRLLIRAIEDLAFQHLPSRRTDRAQCSGKQKAVRIVSTGQRRRSPLWVPSSLAAEPRRQITDSCCFVPLSAGGSAVSFGCVNLMPYTLVTPHRPPTPRPVIILPRILGQILNDRLAEVQGFQKCELEPLPGGDYASRLQRGDVLEESENSPRRCCTIQAVDKAMAQGAHCLLPLGLDCVRRLHRAEIFPIIIFIVSSERSARRLRHKLQRQGSSEEQLLDCSRCEEPLLDKLPCLYRTILPDSWSDSAALLARLRSTILEEQAKIVWVEQDLC
ncbi:CAR14 protein, partial [Atractosteus spatula]|nr:CAR14 protein [Atractosteus spatula]